MNQPYKRTLSQAAALLLTIATLLVAALLIVQCADIYRTGTAPENRSETGVLLRDVYSREIVAERLARMGWAFVLWLAALALTLVSRAVFRTATMKKVELSPETRLELMKARASLTPAMAAEERKRRNAAILCGVVCAACGGIGCVYLFNPEHFASRDLESVMGAMLRRLAPWVVLAFGALTLNAWAREKSVLREIEAAKEAPKRNPEPPAAQKRAWATAGRATVGRATVGRVALYLAAVGLIVAGILNGGMYDVLVKAVNICTECIGLG